jgi:hypothetical protein
MVEIPADVLDAIAMQGAKGTISHEVTRRRDLRRNGKDPKADEAYFQSAVKAWHDALQRWGGHLNDVRIYIKVGGYDSDPRELWEIPEVCRFMVRWARETKALDDPRLLPGARALLQAFGCEPQERQERH